MFVNCFQSHVLHFILRMLFIRMKKKTKLLCSFISILQSQTVMLCRPATSKIIDYSKTEQNLCNMRRGFVQIIRTWLCSTLWLTDYSVSRIITEVSIQYSEIQRSGFKCHIVKFLFGIVITSFSHYVTENSAIRISFSTQYWMKFYIMCYTVCLF